MNDQGPEYPSAGRDRTLMRRIEARRQVIGTRTEAEKRVGAMVRRYEDGDPIRLQLVPKRSRGVEVSWRDSGSQEEPAPREVPLRLADTMANEENLFQVLAIKTLDPRSKYPDRAYYLEIHTPFSSALPRTDTGEPVVYVKPLDEREAKLAARANLVRDVGPVLSENMQELLRTHEIVGVMGAQPVEMEVIEAIKGGK